MRAVPDQIAPWVPGDFASLGTDGFGLSDTRGALRRHFHVDAESITVRVLDAARPARRGRPPVPAPRRSSKYQLLDVRAADPGLGMGDA